MHTLDGVALPVEMSLKTCFVTRVFGTDRGPDVFAEVEVAFEQKGPSAVFDIAIILGVEFRCQ